MPTNRTNKMPEFSRAERKARNEMIKQAGVTNDLRVPPHISRKEMRRRLVESMVTPAMNVMEERVEAANALKIKTVCGADGVTREVKADAELVGLTPFSMAVMTAPEELIDIFLATDKSIVNIQDEQGNTALHYAMLKVSSRRWVVAKLLRAGADSSIMNNAGQKAFGVMMQGHLCTRGN